MGIKDILNRIRERKEKFKDMQDDDRFSEKIQERKLSVNERDLQRYLREAHEENVKHELEEFRKQEHDEIWHGRTALDTPSMFVGHKTSLLNAPSMMRSKVHILNQKRLFTK